MSQVLLGVRNLSLRIAVVAAIGVFLVWLLGGNLLPKADTIANEPVTLSASSDAPAPVRLVQVVNPLELLPSERVTWHVEIKQGDTDWETCVGQATLVDATALVRANAPGSSSAWFGGRTSGASSWTLYKIDATKLDAAPNAEETYTDRLEVERQLARAASGLAPQSADQTAASRESVLHAGDAP